MSQINNKFIELRNWLNSERNYNDGVFLYNKYGNNDNLKRLFPGREKFQARKLAYELAKLAGLTFTEFLTLPEPADCPAVMDDNQENTTANNTDTPPDDQKKANSGMVEYPPLIRRIIHESSRLYNDRSMLKKQQNAIPDANTEENIAKRKELIDMIESLSIRLDILHEAKRAYLEEGIAPDENILFPPPQQQEESVDDLQKRIKNLRSYIAKDNNILNYQRETKQEKPNPLPDSPKRDKILKRIEKNENEIKQIEEKIKNATEKE